MTKTKHLIDFCNNYFAKIAKNDIPDTDDWVIFGEYDINFFGSYLSGKVNDNQLFVEVYKLENTAPKNSLFTFIVG